MLKQFMDAFTSNEETNKMKEREITEREKRIEEKRTNLSEILTTWIKFLKNNDSEEIIKWREPWVDFGVDIDETSTLPFTVIFQRNTFAMGTETLKGELIVKDHAVEKCILENGEIIPGNFTPVEKLTMIEWSRFFNGNASTDEFINKMQRIAEVCNREGCMVVNAKDIIFPEGDNREIDIHMLFGFRLMMIQQNDSLRCEIISPTQLLFKLNKMPEPEVMETFDYEPIVGDELVMADMEPDKGSDIK